MSVSRKEFLREKFDNFKRFIESKTPSHFQPNEDIIQFKSMTEEQLIHFAITHLAPYKNSIDYPTKALCEMFELNFNDKSISLIIAN